jgi:hypothetical protein
LRNTPPSKSALTSTCNTSMLMMQLEFDNSKGKVLEIGRTKGQTFETTSSETTSFRQSS